MAPGRVDIREHAESRAAVGDMDQIKKARDNFHRFIQSQGIDDPCLGQLIDGNRTRYDGKIHHVIFP